MKITRSMMILVVLTCAAAIDSLAGWVPSNNQTQTSNYIRALAFNNTRLFTGTINGVFYSDDNGMSWTQTGAATAKIYSFAVSGNTIFAGDDGGVARSLDNGVTWTRTNIPSTDVVSMLATQGNIWAGSYRNGIYRSTDNGSTWMWVNTGNANTSVRSLLSNGTVLFAGTAGGGIYRSTDNGLTWASSNNGLNGLSMYVYALGGGGNYLFAGTQDGIYRSADNGSSWNKVGLTSATPVYSITVSGQNVFVGTLTGGVFLSTNYGTNWSDISTGLSNKDVYALIIGGNDVLAGTYGAGVYRRPTSEIITPPVIAVRIADTTASSGASISVPVTIGDITNKNVVAFQFALALNTPNHVLKAVEILPGTMLVAASGWTVTSNLSDPDRLIIGAFGSFPLTGSGQLLKIRFTVDSNAVTGQYSDLRFSDFILNSGTPAVEPANGRITIRTIVWGDADENGQIQAYDAAVTLRDAIGLQSLSTQGRLNADVDQNGVIQAYDAALIIRKVVGLPALKESFFSKQGVMLSAAAGFEGDLSRVIKFSGITTEAAILALSFEVAISPVKGQKPSLNCLRLPDEYVSAFNRIDDEHYRMGIINAKGINTDDLKLVISNGGGIRVSQILINNAAAPDIQISETSDSRVPGVFNLIGAYPNPFNPATSIQFELPTAAFVHIEIFDVTGGLVKTIAKRVFSQGRHEMRWDGTNDRNQSTASGHYLCRMTAGSFVKSIKLMLMK